MSRSRLIAVHVLSAAMLVALSGCVTDDATTSSSGKGRELRPADFAAAEQERAANRAAIEDGLARARAAEQAANAGPASTSNGATTGDDEAPPAHTTGAMVGQVNGRPIYAREVFQEIDPQLRQLGVDLPPRVFRQQASILIGVQLRGLVEEALLLGQAERSLTERERAGLQIAMKKHRAELLRQYGGAAEKDAKINIVKRTGRTLEEALQGFRNRLLISKYLREQVQPKIHISRKDVERHFRDNQELYNRPAGRLISMILTDSAENAQQIDARFARGNTFEDIASDPALNKWNADKLGAHDTPIVGSTGWGEAIDSAVKSLDAGERSDRIDLGNRGTAWIKVREISTGERRELKDVQLEIESRLQEDQFRVLTEQYRMELLRDGNFTPVEDMQRALLDVALSQYARGS